MGEKGSHESWDTWFIGIKKEKDHIRSLGIPLHHLLEIVSAIHGIVLSPSTTLVGAAHRTVDHARTVYDHEVIHSCVAAHLQLRVVDQRGTETLQPRETHVRVADEGRSVPVHVSRAGRDDGEGVVRGRHSRGLHTAVQQVVHEGRLAGRVVTQQEHEGEDGVLVGGLVERAAHALVQCLHALQQLLAVQHDARAVSHGAQAAHQRGGGGGGGGRGGGGGHE